MPDGASIQILWILKPMTDGRFYRPSVIGFRIRTISQRNGSKHKTRNSSGDEIANVNFLYDDIVHAVGLKIQ